MNPLEIQGSTGDLFLLFGFRCFYRISVCAIQKLFNHRYQTTMRKTFTHVFVLFPKNAPQVVTEGQK